jgi:cyclopropane-fatty-acyl-phospholipid synthase
MWEFYLASAELAFRYGDQMNFQIQLTKTVGALPIIRDYMLGAEREAPVPAQMRAAE